MVHNHLINMIFSVHNCYFLIALELITYWILYYNISPRFFWEDLWNYITILQSIKMSSDFILELNRLFVSAEWLNVAYQNTLLNIFKQVNFIPFRNKLTCYCQFSWLSSDNIPPSLILTAPASSDTHSTYSVSTLTSDDDQMLKVNTFRKTV